MSVYTIHLTFEIRYTANDGRKVPRPLFKTYDSVPGVFLEFVHLVSTFQLQAIVFQSNSRCSLSSGRYEFTWRKYRPILHRDVIKLLSLFFYIYIYIYTSVEKSRHFRRQTNPISHDILLIDRKTRTLRKIGHAIRWSSDAINALSPVPSFSACALYVPF